MIDPPLNEGDKRCYLCGRTIFHVFPLCRYCITNLVEENWNKYKDSIMQDAIEKLKKKWHI
jgi:DNA-directed RNA polymerase subunit N (RpoN/RPB10)